MTHSKLGCKSWNSCLPSSSSLWFQKWSWPCVKSFFEFPSMDHWWIEWSSFTNMTHENISFLGSRPCSRTHSIIPSIGTQLTNTIFGFTGGMLVTSIQSIRWLWFTINITTVPTVITNGDAISILFKYNINCGRYNWSVSFKYVQ